MNLVFGRGQEHDEFFNEVVFAEASVYYNYPINDFKKHQIRLNALYFALTELISMKINRIDSKQQKEADTTPKNISQQS